MFKNIIVLDLETTGLNSKKDEVLQISVIDEKYNTLLNEYCDTLYVETWNEAEAIHGITPEMVKGKNPISFYKYKIQKLLSEARIILTYNGTFDLEFLEQIGIIVPWEKHLDFMRVFARVYKEPNQWGSGYKWQKLITCANYYGYEFKAHDSLEDVKATLYCYQQYIKSKLL